jgi:hypothetical protein
VGWWWEQEVHQRAPHVAYGYDAFFLAFHGLSEEGEGFADLGLLLCGDVVFSCEL